MLKLLNVHRCKLLYLILKTLNESGHEHIYNAAEKPLQFAQTAALLEVLAERELIFTYCFDLPFCWFPQKIEQFSR